MSGRRKMKGKWGRGRLVKKSNLETNVQRDLEING
jgi:hypothetical protein